MSTERIPLFRVFMPEAAATSVGAVLHSGQVADGAQVRAFETALAERYQTPHVLAVTDVSSAITLALYLAGVRPGDEVLVPPMVCTASTMPIANLFARPRWVDVDARTGMLDPRWLRERASSACKAVLAYHWSGDVADLEGIVREAAALGLKVVEDASDAFGGELHGRPLGSGTADFTALSFRATKQLNSGEGGALICRSAADFERARWLRRYGIHQPSFRQPNGDLNPGSDIVEAGWSFPLTNFAAAIGVAQLPDLEWRLARIRENGRFFDQALRDLAGLTLTPRAPGAVSAYWTYSLQAERRDALVGALNASGIASQRLHVRNDVYTCFSASDRPALPGTDTFDARTLSIPCGWWVSDHDRDRIVARLRAGW